MKPGPFSKPGPPYRHHTTATGNRENNIRGASAIWDWARSIIKLEDASYQGEKRIKVSHEKCNNHKMFDPFILAMDDYLNFTEMGIEGTMTAKERENCLNVRKALDLLGGIADTQKDLIEQYKEVSEIKSDPTAKAHINKAVNYGFIERQYYPAGTGNLQKARYTMPETARV